MTHIRTANIRELATQFASAIVALAEERDRLADDVARLQRRATGVPAARHFDAVSKSPKGYETVLTYLAKWHPEILDQIDWRDPDATLRDGYWCFHHSKGREVWVKSPKIFQPKIKHLRAYPLDVLKDRFGD